MALQKQAVNLELTGGIQRKTDDFLTMPTKLSVLTNGRFVDHNTVRSRGGIAPLLGSSVYPGVIGGSTSLLVNTDGPSAYQRAFQCGGVPVVESATGLHVANAPSLTDTTSNKWRQVDFFHQRCSAEMTSVVHNEETVQGGDFAMDTANNITVHAYAAQRTVLTAHALHVLAKVMRGDVTLAVLDLKEAGANDQQFHPRVLFNSANSKFYVYWVEDNGGGGTGRIRCSVIASSAPTTVASTTTVEASPTNLHFDACVNNTGTCIYLVHKTNAVASVRHLKLNISDGATITTAATSGVGLADAAYFACTVTTATVDTAREGFVGAWRTNAPVDGVQIDVVDLNGAATVVSTAIAPSATDGPFARIAILQDTVDTKAFWLFWDSRAIASNLTCIMRARIRVKSFATVIDGAYTYGLTAGQVARSVGLGTHPMVFGRGVYVGAYYHSSLQPTFFVIQLGYTLNTSTVDPMLSYLGLNNIALRADCGASPNLLTIGISDWRLPCFQSVGNVRYTLQNRAGGDFVLSGATNVTPIGLDQIALDFDAELNAIEYGNATILAGGCPKLFDGLQLTELGFNVYPEVSASTDVGSGTLGAGTYGLTYLYEWQDALGQTHQSAPAPAQALTVGALGRIQWVVTNLRLTQKQNINIVRYRTAKNGTVYHRVKSLVANDPTTNTQTLSSTLDDSADSDVLSGELLPTTGGVIPPQIYPACKFVSQHQERLVFSGLLNRTLIQYTEELQGVFFPWTNSDIYILSVAPEAGRCGATVSMDDKLIIFQENCIGAFFGRGPNRLGVDNNFASFVRLDNAFGLKWAESITLVQDSEGIWFRDRRGLRHLNRGLQISTLQASETQVISKGSEVDDLVGTTCGVTVFQSNKQVIFANGSSLLIWDLENQQWSQYLSSTYPWTFRYPGVYSDQVTFLSAVGGIYAEGTSSLDRV